MAVFTTLLGCSSAPGPLGEQTLDISDFDFSTPLATLLPERYIDAEYGADWYNIPSADGDTNFMRRDTVIGWHTNEPLWVEYLQMGTCSVDAHICFEGHIFNATNLITGLDGRIGVIAGQAAWDTKEACETLIERTTKRHGTPKHTTEQFCNKPYDLFTWTLDDRTIKYAVVGTDESNILKLEIDRDADGHLIDLREGERKQRSQSYIYVFDKGWAEKLSEAGQASGDFVYCQ